MLTPLTTRSVLLCLGLAAAGCRPSGPSGPVVYDFVAHLGEAAIRREVTFIDIGTPEARPHLTRGWSVDEAHGGHTGAWSEGDESWIDFYLHEPRPLTLVLHGQPYPAGDGRPQTVSLVLNDAPLGTVAIAGNRRRHEVPVPESGTREGMNRLRLAYAAATLSDRGAGKRDSRRLAVFWGGLELRGASETAPPRVLPGTNTLLLPRGTRLDYYLEAPAKAVLTLSALAASPAAATLEVRVSTDDAPARVVGVLRPGWGRRTLPLANAAAGPIRVAFTSRAARAAPSGEATLRLVRPVLRASPVPPPPALALPTTVASRRPHVFIYLVDALRADRLGCYGYGRGTSPHLDVFAKEAVLVERCFAHSSWTKASVASLFTGLTPFRHGANDRNDALAPGIPTLAETLRAGGYRTVMVYANAWVGPPFGLQRGFEDTRRLHLARSDRIEREIENVLDQAAGDPRPLFLYVHTIDPHDPYDPPSEQWRRFAAPVTRLRRVSHAALGRIQAEVQDHPGRKARYAEQLSALYDAEVAANDEQFGRFVEQLRRRGLLDRSLVVFTADHGEEFLEHGRLMHGQTLYPEVLHVPLVIRFPGGVSGGVRVPALRHVDMLPTILELVGLPLPRDLDGERLGAHPSTEDRPSLAHLQLDGRRLSSWTRGCWHAIRMETSPGPGGFALYDLRGSGGPEPAERHPVTLGTARSALDAASRTGPARVVPEVLPSKEVLESLKALGYVR
jgi:choline-sulfatase